MKYDRIERLNEASWPNNQHANQTQWIEFLLHALPMVNGVMVECYKWSELEK